jgi:hypothetical protein
MAKAEHVLRVPASALIARARLARCHRQEACVAHAADHVGGRNVGVARAPALVRLAREGGGGHAANVLVGEPTGLSPWWTTEGAEVQRLLLSVPGSEIERRMLALSRERAVYRLALGMPDQADLIALLLSRDQDATLDPAEVCLDLAARLPLAIRPSR